MRSRGTAWMLGLTSDNCNPAVMSSPPLPSQAKLPATGSSAACLPRPRDRHLLVRGWSAGAGAGATPLVAASSSSGPACCHHYSVATAPSLRAASTSSRRGGGAGLDALTVTASAVRSPVPTSPRDPNPACRFKYPLDD
jgi:hypothetical protein